jgi:hypothetical protein
MKRSVAARSALALTVTLSLSAIGLCPAAQADSHQARYAPAFTGVPASQRMMDLKNVPDFDNSSQQSSGSTSSRNAGNDATGAGTSLQAGAESTTLPVETRLRLVLESAVDAKSSQPGDIFEGHVKEDLFLGSQLLLPKGSLVRGRVADVTRPRMLSRAAKIGLKLEQIVTPSGEVIPLDAALEFRKGQTNARGQLDPGTNFGTRVGDDLKSVTGLNSKSGTTRGALMAANIATLGAPAAATLIGGSAIALFRSGDNVSLAPGQELEILLTNDLGVQIN